MNVFVIGTDSDNELVISEVLDILHQWFDDVFSHVIDRENLTSNMTAVILIIDELIDGGIIMAYEAEVVLQRINIKHGDVKKSSKKTSKKEEEKLPEQTGNNYYSFASVFSSAKSQLAKTLAL